MPKIDIILSKIRELKYEDVLQIIIFEEEIIPADDSPVWPWSRSSFYRFMKDIGYIYDDRISPYVHMKNRDDIILMRKNYPKWIKFYRGKEYYIFYQDETWVFKNMACSKTWIDTVEDST